MNKPIIYEPKTTNTEIPRDIRDRFADILNVKDYGAVGNGNTNDTQAFKNAKSAANTKNTVVYVPYGTYKITENITDNQSDISANAHTFLTDGHVTITGGGTVNILDLSKSVDRSYFSSNAVTSSHFTGNTPFIISSGKINLRLNDGLQTITSGNVQYLGIKSKSNDPITIDSNGIGLNIGDGFEVVSNTLYPKTEVPITVTSGGISFIPGDNSTVTVNSSGKLGLNVGSGLEVTSNGVLNNTEIYTAGSGINISSNVISVNTSAFLTKGTNYLVVGQTGICWGTVTQPNQALYPIVFSSTPITVVTSTDTNSDEAAVYSGTVSGFYVDAGDDGVTCNYMAIGAFSHIAS